MKQNDHTFFANTACKYYPCHADVDSDGLNCMFCFCPLYTADCGGQYTFTAAGIKDCSACLLPHTKDGFAYIVARLAAEHIDLEERK